MGATNTTPNYNLSQFIGTDKPAWLQDYNGDMLKIDTGINAAKVAADGAQNAAGAAQNDATTANNAITNTINPAISSLNTTVGNQGGAINTINSLIGNGTPTTTDQTIIGAINEINANINPASTAVSGVGNVVKIGNVVILSVQLTNKSTGSASEVLGTLSDNYKPTSNVTRVATIVDSANAKPYQKTITINTDGEIRVGQQLTAADIVSVIVYTI